MSYLDLVKTPLIALAEEVQAIKDGELAAFKTVAMTEPDKLDIKRMPAVYILLDDDAIERKTKYLEIHTLSVTFSVIHVVKGTTHRDTDLEKGFHDGLKLVGLVYDTLSTNRSYNIELVDYGRIPLDTGVVFWGEINLKLSLRYAPGKPDEAVLMQEVYTKEA
ncbi:MAG: hypothetical protein ABFD18_06255 [Syntrophomonas sp.]